MAYKLDPLPFFDARANGLTLIGNTLDTRVGKVTPRRLSRFVRTPDGEGLGIIREDGTVEVWKTSSGGRSITFHAEISETDPDIPLVVILQGGTYIQ